MSFTLADILDGTNPVPITLHLATVSPTLPWQLGTLPEASFAGYQPADFTAPQRLGYQGGFGFLQGTATFTNDDPVNHVTAVAAWLTAPDDSAPGGIALLCVVDPVSIDLPPGMTTLSFQFSSFERV